MAFHAGRQRSLGGLPLLEQKPIVGLGQANLVRRQWGCEQVSKDNGEVGGQHSQG